MTLQSPKHDNDLSRVLHNLTLHTPNPEVGLLMDQIRTHCKAMAVLICKRVPQGRERSMALTAIEDACMYAIAGLARAVEVEDGQ